MLSRDYLESWERKILETCPTRPACMGLKCTANEGTDYYADCPEDDTVEPGLHALNLTYDACQQSFIAADEDRMKASTQYFEDTGVIALLCHHDIPLAVASMWTAGEKQFYVFVLLDTILKHVPSHWRIGALYDIGCQMDQTLKNSGIILANQSSGDSQMVKGVSSFGHCLEEAEMKLSDCSPSYLMEQFKAQREYHSRPVSCQSQTKGAQAVEWIISLMATLEAQQGNLKDLIAEGNDLVQDDMTASNEVQAEWQEKVRLLKEAIQLKKDKWVNIQLNLHALREQLLKKLRARKFELATLDRANLSRILDQKTKAHVKKAVKNQSGGMMLLLKELVALRGRGGIWRDAYIPPMLTMDGLYKLDVDQDIWEDSQGDIMDFPDGVVPLGWQIPQSKNVSGSHRRWPAASRSLRGARMWFHEEYSAAMDLFMGSKDEDVSYFGLLQAHQLYDWMTAWKKDIVQVPIAPGAPSWDSVRMPLALHQHYGVRSNIQVQLEQESLVATTTPPCPDHNSQSRRNLDDFDASSDDDLEGGELEEFFELEEAGLIAVVDQAIVELDLDSE
ncbi:hypothetical protein BS47DRAFT_1359098 [Hydnum rufescens UP504]|uniref:Uncharacterized protein n=1 Tax=Hydnum rufescens UP504 TaxID=1448309 RepID=A0A9P6B5J7_9AGAM|nr:hypothetical protein BS47DRAFT_1359098 [Hydnum rufescens UP504]